MSVVVSSTHSFFQEVQSVILSFSVYLWDAGVQDFFT